MRLIRCHSLVVLASCALLSNSSAQEPEPSPTTETEPQVEPSPIPGTEVLLTPESPPQASPGPKRILKLGLPGVIEPILPPIDFNAIARSGRLWSFHGTVKEFRFVGNHVFSSQALSKVIAKYYNREVNADDLEQARQELTLFYVNHGYVNSGAVLPNQDGKDGIITFQLVEGRLTAINVKGNFWFRPWWLRNEIRRGAGRPLNFNHLKEGLQLLRQNPTITRVNAELKPGSVPGESILDVDIKDAQPFRFALELNNQRPPSDGAEILNAHATDLNLTGHNDVLDIIYGIAHSNGADSFDGFDFSGLDNIAGSYAFPITPWATTLQLHAAKSDTSIIEEPFTTLNITSNLEEYGATVRQPLHQTLNNEFAVSITAEKRRSETFLLGQPFSLSPGAVNGVTSEFVLRFAAEFVNRSQVHVLALRSTVNVGIDAFDATNSGSEPDSHFVSWLGQGQYIRRLWKTDNLLVLRLNVQISDAPLFSLEQLVLGGMDTVRGYRENQILRDNGVLGSLEVRVPVLYGKEHRPILMIAPFVDIGSGWNNTVGGSGTTSPETLPSTGIGLIFDPDRHVHAQLYWGYAFNRDVLAHGNNLQDYGFHFFVSVNAF